MGLFSRKNKDKYLHGFAKTSHSFGRKLRIVFQNRKKNKEDFMEQLMVTLIEADIGYKTSEKICDRFFEICSDYMFVTPKDVMTYLGQSFREIYDPESDGPISENADGPTVILLVGVNGSGKTSTCAKLANMYLEEGKTVALVAADTFRAGATEQLKQWADRLSIPCICGKEKEDPSSVLVKGCRYAKENNVDILLCDTAGRLQNKINLMAELEKMHKVLGKEIEGAPHDTWLVLDANTGQNGLSQAELFHEITDLDGIILTKMDGTSKGGIILAIKNVTGIPVRYITVGEQMEDLQEFDFDLYLDSIIGELIDEA